MLQPQIFSTQVEAQPVSIEVKPSKEAGGRNSVLSFEIVMDSSFDKLLSDTSNSNSSASSIISDSTHQIVQLHTSITYPVLTTTGSSTTTTTSSTKTTGSRTSPCISIPCASPMASTTTATTTTPSIPSASMPPSEMAGKFLYILCF